jgi:hypothetical protein
MAGDAMAQGGISRKDRLRAQDLEECGRVGEEFGLGAVEAVARDLDDRTGLRRAGRAAITVGVLGLFVAVPIVGGVTTLGPDTVTVAVISGALLILGGLLAGVGRRLANVSGWLCLYSGGLARINRKNPEPKVLHWADVEAVVIVTGDDEGTPTTTMTSCTVRGRTGVEFKASYAIREQVALAAYQNLAPRISAAMIDAYNSGQPVIADRARVDHAGVTFPKGRHLSWGEIGIVVMGHPSGAAASVTTRMDFRKGEKWPRRYFDPSSVPNGIFLADVIAHAARQRGVRVEGYQGISA